METVENKVADAILQEKKKIEVGKHVFYVSSPTLATLIEVSKLISYLPEIKLDNENIAIESLNIAKHCEILGKIASTMILGISKQPNTPFRNLRLLKRLKSSQQNRKIQDLADYIVHNMSPKEIEYLFQELMKLLELGFFFQIFTSLSEVNLIRPTV